MQGPREVRRGFRGTGARPDFFEDRDVEASIGLRGCIGVEDKLRVDR